MANINDEYIHAAWQRICKWGAVNISKSVELDNSLM